MKGGETSSPTQTEKIRPDLQDKEDGKIDGALKKKSRGGKWGVFSSLGREGKNATVGAY